MGVREPGHLGAGRRALGLAPVLAAATAIVGLLIFAIAPQRPAAVNDPPHRLPQRSRAGLPGPTTTSLPTQTPRTAKVSSEHTTELFAIPNLLAGIVAALVILAIGYLLVRAIKRYLDRRQRAPRERITEQAPAQRTEKVQQATREGIVELETGDPSDAIVRAWLRVVRAVREVGIAELPSDTAADLVRRVGRELSFTPDPLLDLAELYREARYSSHVMGETERQRAAADLQAVLDEFESTAKQTPTVGSAS